jgi:beta-glucan synthesis-associated protein KRE6
MAKARFLTRYVFSLVHRACLSLSGVPQFSLSPDPSLWGADLSPNHPEADDYLHNPDPKRDRKNDHGGTFFTSRGLFNLGCIAILVIGLLTLLYALVFTLHDPFLIISLRSAGYPLITYFNRHPFSTFGAFNLGGINSTGQVPAMAGNFASLIDPATPPEAFHKASLQDGTTWDLVFSDEFNTPNRTFYPGDDPYWEAVDLHYWATNNLEWYDPAAITTEGGHLKITFDQIRNHDLDYTGGLLSSWNKFCFTGGYIEGRRLFVHPITRVYLFHSKRLAAGLE